MLERGHKVITLSHLPGHSLDISADYPNLYWPFGQHILSGAKLIAHHPNLYAVYLTNHGCGPDTMMAHLFRQEMGEKPYLQIEVDEHFSPVGVITRIEAFLNSLSHRPALPLPEGFNLKAVSVRTTILPAQPRASLPLWLPDLGWYTPSLVQYYRAGGVDARALPPLDEHALALGRAETSAKEYLPFPALLGSVLAAREYDAAPAQYLIPQTEGSEADGQYARVIRAVLDRRKQQDAMLVAPTLERLPGTARDRDALLRTVLMGDLLYAVPAAQRDTVSRGLPSDRIATWDELNALAERIGSMPASGRVLASVGTPLCLTVLDDGVLTTLEQEGNSILRTPLAEALWFLWKDCDENNAHTAWLAEVSRRMQAVGKALGAHSAFSATPEALFAAADKALPRFSGSNGRYRYAKAIELSHRAAAVLTLAPRYENTATILEMRGLKQAATAPLFALALDHDWDEAAQSRLRSFLYYC